MAKPLLQHEYRPGQRVRVTQQIPRIKDTLTIAVEGVVRRFGQQKTGSWFAHSKDNKVWLDRLEILKSDGEVVVCNLDQYSRVELLEDAPEGAGEGVGTPRG
ncbi:MAG: hypothetical protein EA379_07805 [Phycisphaerales bacterium]|nr:MAG: hypothetical protein EA379_07805 [Phycisphaerales bacterium]